MNDNKVKKIIDSFDKNINDLKRIESSLQNINKENFLSNEKICIVALNDIMNIVSNYKASFNTISTIKAQMNLDDYNMFVRDLNINLNQLNRILRKIFTTMIDQSNLETDKYKYLEDILKNNFYPLINDNSFNKVILDKEKQTAIKNSIDDLVLHLDEIIKRNEPKKQNFADLKLDIPLDMPTIKKEPNPYEEELDIPSFVNSRYEETRQNNKVNSNPEIEKYLKKFYILKERLKRKSRYNSLTIKEVELYNKLESELLNLKDEKNNIKIKIKIKIYFKKLEKKLKLNKDNYYKYLVKKEINKVR